MNGRNYNTASYVKAFRTVTVAPHHLRMLQANFYAPHSTITATQMSKALGYPNHSSANLHYGKLARLIAKQLGWRPLPDPIVYALVTFEKPGQEWHWILRPAVAKALEQLGWIEGCHPLLPEEVETPARFREGAVSRITVNAYERSIAAREKCIRHYGCRCAICGLLLAEQYGEVAQGLIHVHHLRELASISTKYTVDPVEDLRPVCPNCHAVIHSRKPALTIESVKRMIASNKTKASKKKRSAS